MLSVTLCSSRAASFFFYRIPRLIHPPPCFFFIPFPSTHKSIYPKSSVLVPNSLSLFILFLHPNSFYLLLLPHFHPLTHVSSKFYLCYSHCLFFIFSSPGPLFSMQSLISLCHHTLILNHELSLSYILFSYLSFLL